VSGRRLLACQKALDAQRFADLVRACDDGERDLKPALRDLLHYHLATPRLRTRELARELQSLIPRGSNRTPSLPPASESR
jgi:DNA repair protein RecO (recombination protein O)